MVMDCHVHAPAPEREGKGLTQASARASDECNPAAEFHLRAPRW
jgi:hypothetical protein